MKEKIIKLADLLFMAGAIPVLLMILLSIVQDFTGVVYLSDSLMNRIGFAYIVLALVARIGNKKNSILD